MRAIASLETKLEAKTVELRESQRRQESFESKLEAQTGGHENLAAVLKEKIAKIASLEAKLEAAKTAEAREKGQDTPASTPNSTPKLNARGFVSPSSTLKRNAHGIYKTVKKGLEEAVEDDNGVKAFSQVTRNLSVILHAVPEVVLESIVGR